MIFYICCGSVIRYIRYIGAEFKVRKLSGNTRITPNTGRSANPTEKFIRYMSTDKMFYFLTCKSFFYCRIKELKALVTKYRIMLLLLRSFCLDFCGFIVPLVRFSLIWIHNHYRWRVVNLLSVLVAISSKGF